MQTVDSRTPPGFRDRPPTLEDLDAVLRLILACDVEEFGEPDFDPSDLLDEWTRPRFELEADARIVLDESDQVVGYTDVWDRKEFVLIQPNGCVHPQARGRGLGTFLLRWAEGRAAELVERARPRAPYRLETGVAHVNAAGSTLLEDHGYRPARRFLRMEVEMDVPPDAPRWPEGIEVRVIRSGEEHAVHAAVYEAFRDTVGQVQSPFEDWKHTMIERDGFDPSLWFLAIDGDEIAGTALCYDELGIGWVRQLTVRRPWRRRGLAVAMLQHAFGQFYLRGRRKIGLMVDSDNSTGATRVYEAAGMRPVHRFDFYDKTVAVD